MIKKRKYTIIYADPPWNFGSRLKHSRNGSQHRITEQYPTMRIEEICALPIDNLSKDNAILFIWTTDAHLEKCLQVINAWGFTYKTIAFIWNKKEKSGKQVCFQGMWTMKGSEICLLATKGKVHGLLKSRKVRQLVEATRQEHSKKPDEVRERIVEMFGNISRIELFARQKAEGWHFWGNEIDSSIDLKDYIGE